MTRALVLIVDDEPAFLRMVAAAVRILGCEAVAAPDAESAIELMRESRPDLALVDVRLPDMDGVELARLIKSEHAIPVLLMSGFGRPAVHQADRFLAKPFHIDELSSAINPYLSKS